MNTFLLHQGYNSLFTMLTTLAVFCIALFNIVLISMLILKARLQKKQIDTAIQSQYNQIRKQYRKEDYISSPVLTKLVRESMIHMN